MGEAAAQPSPVPAPWHASHAVQRLRPLSGLAPADLPHFYLQAPRLPATLSMRPPARPGPPVNLAPRRPHSPLPTRPSWFPALLP